MDALARAMENLVVALREGVEIALVLGILLAYLRRTGRAAYGRVALLGLGSAVVASLIVAVVLRWAGVDTQGPVVEGTLMLVAAGLVASLALWMWRKGRTLRRRLEHRVEALAGPADAALGIRAAAGIFALAFFITFREGVETVLFLLALSSAGGRPAATAAGVIAGLGLATLFGFLLVRGSLRLDLRRFFSVTGLILLVLVVKLVAGGLHEFMEHGLLPANPFWAEILELLTHRTTSLLVLVLLVAAPLLLLLRDYWRGGPVAARSR